jgi:hypothetical protein
MNGCHGCRPAILESARPASRRIGISLGRKPVANKKSTTLERGIRLRGDKLEAYARLNGRTVWAYYPEGIAAIETAREWRRRIRKAKTTLVRLEGRITLPALDPDDVPSLPPGKTWIYFIQASDYTCKIGRASDPFRRLAELQCAHHTRLRIVAILAAAPSIEKQIHVRFHKQRKEGEWFGMSAELRGLIEKIRAGTVDEVAFLHLLMSGR